MFGLFLSYCILYVLHHIRSCPTGFRDLENVFFSDSVGPNVSKMYSFQISKNSERKYITNWTTDPNVLVASCCQQGHAGSKTLHRQKFLFICCCVVWVPSVLRHCWLGGRKGIRPVKTEWWGCWRGYLSGARCRLAYGPADTTATHCLLLVCVCVCVRACVRVCARARCCVVLFNALLPSQHHLTADACEYKACLL